LDLESIAKCAREKTLPIMRLCGLNFLKHRPEACARR
jgi:hypothetical protein